MEQPGSGLSETYFPVLQFDSGGAYCLSDIKTVSFRSFKYSLNEALKLEQNLRTS